MRKGRANKTYTSYGSLACRKPAGICLCHFIIGELMGHAYLDFSSDYGTGADFCTAPQQRFFHMPKSLIFNVPTPGPVKNVKYVLLTQTINDAFLPSFRSTTGRIPHGFYNKLRKGTIACHNIRLIFPSFRRAKRYSIKPKSSREEYLRRPCGLCSGP